MTPRLDLMISPHLEKELISREQIYISSSKALKKIQESYKGWERKQKFQDQQWSVIRES
jgi:hypothetical protein